MTLASYLPGGVQPIPLGEPGVSLAGTVAALPGGSVAFRPSTRQADLYVLGHDRWRWVNVAGLLVILGAVAGAGIHAAMRIRHGRWRLEPEADCGKVGDT